MKKIAVPTRGNVVDDHFGHCEYYTIYTVDDNNQITDRSRLDSPQGCGCKSNIASVMEEMGISLMLAGNMGNGAYAKLTDHHIEVIRGCHGATEQVIQDYLAGELHDSAEACDHHDCDHHHDEEQPVYHVAFPTQK